MANLDALDGTAEREQSRRPACFSADDARLAMLVFHNMAWREMMGYGGEEIIGEIFEAWIFEAAPATSSNQRAPITDWPVDGAELGDSL